MFLAQYLLKISDRPGEIVTARARGETMQVAQNKNNGEKKTVLFVDDEQIVLDVGSLMLDPPTHPLKLHPISNIQYLISNIQYPISNIQYPISVSGGAVRAHPAKASTGVRRAARSEG